MKYSLKKHLLEMKRHLPADAKAYRNYQMLADLNNSPDFRLISSGDGQFPNGLEARFEWAATDDCMYEIRLTADYDDIIFIETIEAVHNMGDEYNDMCEGQGYASDMMYELMEFADDHDVQLSLVADAFNQLDDDDRRPDTAVLTAWYKRLGFVDSPQGNGTLVYNFIHRAM